MSAEDADKATDLIIEAVNDNIDWDEEVEFEGGGFFETDDSASEDFDFDFSTIIRGHGTYDPPVYYLRNGDPGYPAEWDDDWDDLPSKINIRKMKEQLKDKLPIEDISYVFLDPSDDYDVDFYS